MRRVLASLALVILLSLMWVDPLVGQDGTYHVVRPGETLARIALEYHTTVDILLRANGLADASQVQAGQTLFVPEASATQSPAQPSPYAPGARVHTVQPGESLLRIAQLYGLTPEAILIANHIPDPDLIAPGQVLIIASDGAADDLGLFAVAPIQSEVEAGEPAPADDAEAAREESRSAPEDTVSAAPDEEAPPETTAAAPVRENPLEERSGDVARAAVEEAPDEAAAQAEPAGREPDEKPGVVIYRAEVPAPAAPVDAGVTDPSAVIPDLGIIVPSAPAWLLQPGLVTSGGPDVRAIYERGLALGNNPHAFSKIGDCNSEPPFFLSRFDGGSYDLGPYAELQFVVDAFKGSFARVSMAAWTGNHAWAVFDPTWSNPAYCLPGEMPIACEFRVQRPSIAFVSLGTNEAYTPDLFEENLRRIVEFSIDNGVVPILGTKADQLEGSDRNNEIVRALADEYVVPLWDFGRAADSLPGRGLQPDGFHLTYVEPYFAQAAALQAGHSVRNLTALMALDAVWRSVAHDAPPAKGVG